MTIEEMKKQKLQLSYDIAALVQKFEQESGMKVDAITVARQEGISPIGSGEHRSDFLGVKLEASLNG